MEHLILQRRRSQCKYLVLLIDLIYCLDPSFLPKEGHETYLEETFIFDLMHCTVGVVARKKIIAAPKKDCDEAESN